MVLPKEVQPAPETSEETEAQIRDRQAQGHTEPMAKLKPEPGFPTPRLVALTPCWLPALSQDFLRTSGKEPPESSPLDKVGLETPGHSHPLPLRIIPLGGGGAQQIPYSWKIKLSSWLQINMVRDQLVDSMLPAGQLGRST